MRPAIRASTWSRTAVSPDATLVVVLSADRGGIGGADGPGKLASIGVLVQAVANSPSTATPVLSRTGRFSHW